MASLPGAGGVLTSEDPHERPVCRWRRNQDGAICRKGIKKMLEVLVVRPPRSESWALPGVSRRPVGPFHPQTRPSPRGHRPSPRGHRPTVLDSVPGPEGQSGTGHWEEVPFLSAPSVVGKMGSEVLEPVGSEQELRAGAASTPGPGRLAALTAAGADAAPPVGVSTGPCVLCSAELSPRDRPVAGLWGGGEWQVVGVKAGGHPKTLWGQN